jgi:hypothetical protein
MIRQTALPCLALALVLCAGQPIRASDAPAVYPGEEWETKQPNEVGLDAGKLKAFSDYTSGFGCVVRHGYMVYTWGDASRRMDVASAAKPVYAHFLFEALEDGRIFNLDEPVCKWEPRLKHINPDLDNKDSRITWRHMANQISCYGLAEEPGTAYAYNDWQMALLFDTLFTKVYGARHLTVDERVLHAELTDRLGCQDNPTFLAFGIKDRAARLGISPRDFARFGLLYLHEGRWKDEQLLSPELARMAVTDPVPNAIPRAGTVAANMIEGQRSIGSRRIPDNQTDHMGSYSWLWWINGVDREDRWHWPDAPAEAFGCFGHGGRRAMIVLPGLDLIVSWNNTRIEGREMENKALGLLLDAAEQKRPSRDADNITMWECADWRSPVIEYVGNPFDVRATVTLRHSQSGTERKTQMYYAGQGRWEFRFPGTRAGYWTFRTTSDVPDLDGHSGGVEVHDRGDEVMKGFLTHVGNKYAIQVRDETDLHGYLFNVYMGRVEHCAFLDEFGSDLADVKEKALAYLADARYNGFEIIFVHVNNNWFKFGTRRHDEHDSVNPDPLTFEVLETIIQTVQRAGGRVHIWAWGDESRKWTPRGVPGGINGHADRRLQRYIAARLGPLPGWTMGYGFDLHEWTNETELNAWAEYLHAHMGWQHLLCSRGYPLRGPYNINSYDGFGRDVPLATTAHGPADYDEIVEDLDSDVTKPHLYEERHSYLREGFNLDMDGTRRLLWWEAMAGGMGGFFGFYPDSPHPYPNPAQLQTHYDFWHKGGRFLLAMQPANDLIEDGYALWSPAAESGVFYAEDAERFSICLPTTSNVQPFAAFDVRNAAEWQHSVIPVAPSGGDLSDPLRHRSDWGFAMGLFGQGPVPVPDAFYGLITVNEACPRWPAQAWPAREWTRPFFMCGPGDPEDFLYRGALNPDGTRDGDQMELIEKLKGTGANCIYLMAVRSHGGDGEATHNPFVDHDPARGINPRVLDQWEEWFTEMDRHGIVIYFFLYDDSARLWNTGGDVGEPEREFIETLVNRFEHHGHLMWCIAEEYSEALSVERVKKIAALIKAADDYNHPVAVHQHHGLDFSEFADDPHIDQFAIQYNVKTAEELHAGVLQAWRDAKGRYSLNLSEAADWGTGAEARKKAWACAMGGAQVMVLRMDIATTPESDLRDCGNVVRFFEGLMDLCAMEPHDELAYGDTEYVLANPPDEYMVYTSHSTGQLGLKGMKAGAHDFRWLDCATGRQESQERVAVTGGDQTWKTPAGFGPEVAVYIRRTIP